MNAAPMRRAQAAVGALLAFVWAVTVGALRDFVWADVRTGLIDIRSLPRTTRQLVIVAFALLAALLLMLVNGDLWRTWFDLEPAMVDSPGRGVLLPVVLLPVTLFMLTVAWSLALAGARYSHWLLRLAVLALFALLAVSWLNRLALASAGWQLAAWFCFLSVFALVLSPRRWLPLPYWIFLPLLLAVGGLFGIVQWQVVHWARLSGLPLGQAGLESDIQVWAGLVMPLLVLVGLNISEFVVSLSGWTTSIVTERLPRNAIYLAAAGLASCLGLTLAQELGAPYRQQGLEAFVRAVAGAGGAFLFALIWWAALTRRRPPGEFKVAGLLAAAGRWGPVLAVGFLLLSLLNDLLAPATQALAMAAIMASPEAQSAVLPLLAVVEPLFNGLIDMVTPWQQVMATSLLLVALLLAARQRRHAALYVGMVGIAAAWGQLTGFDAPMAWLRWEQAELVSVWWFLLTAGIGLWWLFRRRLTPVRAGAIAFVCLALLLLRQTSFIENPFSPLFAFAGVSFIAFGLTWDVLTAGSWANDETQELPRASRVMLYLAYVLLTATLVNWAVASHDLNLLGRFMGGAAVRGLGLLGKPLLYSVFLALLLGHDEITRPGSDR